MSQAARYYVPEPSRWPIFGSIALLLMAFGAAMWLNHAAAGPYLVAGGFAVLIYMLFGWFGAVVHESENTCVAAVGNLQQHGAIPQVNIFWPDSNEVR